MKKCNPLDHGMYFTNKIWASGLSWGVTKVSGSYSSALVEQHTMYYNLIPGCMQHSTFATNVYF